jgi:hypothetical protein
MMNLIGCARKRSCPNLRYYPGICVHLQSCNNTHAILYLSTSTVLVVTEWNVQRIKEKNTKIYDVISLIMKQKE